MNIKLHNVRLSFPSLFKPTVFGGGKRGGESQGEPKYQATFILDEEKNADQIKEIREGIQAVLREKYGDKIPKGFKPCLRPGTDYPDTDGYGEGVMFVASRAAKRPVVVDRDRAPLTEDDDKPYAGCYVNASIRLWVQDNQWGKRVNAALRAVQFAGDGDPFGEKAVDPNDEFEDLSGESQSAGTSLL